MRRLLIVTIMLVFAAPAVNAQGAEVDRRIDRIEREVRALQRSVFPGGSADFFEPDIQSGRTGNVTGSPASAPLTDLTDRVNSLEGQLRTLTGQVEQNSFQLRQLRSEVEALRTRGATTIPSDDEDMAVSGDSASIDDSTTATTPPANDSASDTASSTSNPESGEPPLPDDPAEASYVRGYRLWRDGQYEASRTQLRQTIADHPGHRFESFARNLLGRAYLDDNKPANATEIFVRNYQEIPNGDRAADSLFYLGVALNELNYNERACLAFEELQEVYGENLRSTISEQVPAARAAAECN